MITKESYYMSTDTETNEALIGKYIEIQYPRYNGIARGFSKITGYDETKERPFIRGVIDYLEGGGIRYAKKSDNGLMHCGDEGRYIQFRVVDVTAEQEEELAYLSNEVSEAYDNVGALNFDDARNDEPKLKDFGSSAAWNRAFNVWFDNVYTERYNKYSAVAIVLRQKEKDLRDYIYTILDNNEN